MRKLVPPSGHNVTVSTLSELVAALADAAVDVVIIQADIRLDGKELSLAGRGRRLSVSAGAGCVGTTGSAPRWSPAAGGLNCSSGGTARPPALDSAPPCTIDARGLSRHFLVRAARNSVTTPQTR